jgi:hypothetical protein
MSKLPETDEMDKQDADWNTGDVDRITWLALTLNRINLCNKWHSLKV